MGNFSFIVFSNKFSISCSSSSPSGTPMIQMLECLKLSWRFLSLSSFFGILVSSLCYGWMFISSFCSKLLIWVPVSFLSLLVPFLSLLVPCTFSFISLCIAFTFPPVCDQTHPLLKTAWLPVFWTLQLIGWLFLHCLLLFLDLWWVLSFGLYFFVSVSLLHSKGWSLRYSPGQATHIAALWHCMWGQGLRGISAICSALCRLSVTHPSTTCKLGPSGADSQVGGFVYILGPCGSLQQTLLWGWEFLLLPQPPQVCTARGFWGFLFLLEPWIAWYVSLPSCSS